MGSPPENPDPKSDRGDPPGADRREIIIKCFRPRTEETSEKRALQGFETD